LTPESDQKYAIGSLPLPKEEVAHLPAYLRHVQASAVPVADDPTPPVPVVVAKAHPIFPVTDRESRMPSSPCEGAVMCKRVDNVVDSGGIGQKRFTSMEGRRASFEEKTSATGTSPMLIAALCQLVRRQVARRSR